MQAGDAGQARVDRGDASQASKRCAGHFRGSAAWLPPRLLHGVTKSLTWRSDRRDARKRAPLAERPSMSDLPVPEFALTEELKTLVNNALGDGAPLLLAAVSPDGRPVLSYRGSVQTFGDDQLGLWVR